MNTSAITPERVRNFLLIKYAERITTSGENQVEIPDNFDFLLEGIVDSFGILEMVGALETEFGIELDMSGLAAEEITVLGPLARYVAAQANAHEAGKVRPGLPPVPGLSAGSINNDA
jgi:acyl carrier protein